MSGLKKAWFGFECDVPVPSTRRCPWVCVDWSGDREKSDLEVGSRDYWQEKTRDNWNHELLYQQLCLQSPAQPVREDRHFPCCL